MKNQLIIKENELLNPMDYSEDQKCLVEDFNRRIKNITGIVTGIGKEYHTIWLVNINDLTMRLYRTTGENTISSAVEKGVECNDYETFIKDYLDKYLVDESKKVYDQVRFKNVMEEIRDGSLYTVDYLRMTEEGKISYHQMAFALAGADGEADYFIFAFKDIDEAIRKHIQDKEYLRNQLNIMAALSRDYYNIFKINPVDGSVVIIKLDGYVTKGMEGPGEKKYSYDALYKQYIKDRVYVEDQSAMVKAMGLEAIKKKTKPGKEYVSSYRVLDKGEIHYYQFTYLLIDEDNPNEGILAGFKNVDDIVESAREREALAILAETDIMTGILNRGSGERKVIDALKNGKCGMLCIMDIDKFKYINDNFGHDVGDKVIIAVANIINKTFRKNDIVFRLGGDEFFAFAEGISEEENGKTIIERIFKKIRKLDITELAGHEICMSAGAVIRSVNDPDDFEELYKKVDKSIYKSKEVEGSYITFDRAAH